ncbi:MAG: hypothetical protein HY774_20730 [Acidobacteria bacterium]|nr:hypothetical protein [Acidobacteriota bacterium]
MSTKTISLGVIESSSTEPDFNSFYEIITKFRRELPDDQKYRINLRIINYVPTLSFQIIDGDQPNGTILVELTPNKIKVSERPHFILHANNDAHKIWYQKILNNCEEMFKSEEERINNNDMSETNKDKIAIPWKWPEY